MEEYNDTDSVTVREFKRLRNNLELAQKEITKLKLSPKQNDEEIKNSESVRASIAALANARVNGLINENNELKAQVETLRAAAIFTDKEFRHHAMVESFETTVLSEALVKTRGQSLQSVRVDAVKSFGHEIGLYDSEYDDQEYIEVSRNSIRDHIEQLCDGKS